MWVEERTLGCMGLIFGNSEPNGVIDLSLQT